MDRYMATYHKIVGK